MRKFAKVSCVTGDGSSRYIEITDEFTDAVYAAKLIGLTQYVPDNIKLFMAIELPHPHFIVKRSSSLLNFSGFDVSLLFTKNKLTCKIEVLYDNTP